MKFTMEVSMDNAAFEDEPATELARILHKAAEQAEEGYFSAPTMDINGNGCGRWEVRG